MYKALMSITALAVLAAISYEGFKPHYTLDDTSEAMEAQIRTSYQASGEVVKEVRLVKSGDFTMTGYVRLSRSNGQELTATCEVHASPEGKGYFHCDEAK